MSNNDAEIISRIKTLPSLMKYLRDELAWPVETDDIEELTYEYDPNELGIDVKNAAKIKEIRQIRPLDSNQPWGIFWVNFEKKQFPMVVLRRILGSLVIKRREAYRKTDRPAWHRHDLLFISSYGEEEHRNISFAHFSGDLDTGELPVLHVLGWDDRNTKMHYDRVVRKLHSNLQWPDDTSDVDHWREKWSEGFTDRYREAIRSADELIPKLAELAANIRIKINTILEAETDQGPMRKIFSAVQKLLIHDMTEDGFSDMYAQTIAYGLLSAEFSRSVGNAENSLLNMVSVSNPFLENLIGSLFKINRGKHNFNVDEIGINDVRELLKNTNIEAIKAAFSDRNPDEDPVIRFYEGFLKEYDAQQRVKRGVFFTPRPVVSYIVRSVHEFLQKEFGLEDGLASIDTWADMKKRFENIEIPDGTAASDPFVCILDPATGTGTFLFECIEVIERTIKNKWQKVIGCKNWNNEEIKNRWKEYVSEHLLSRLYGYELMMAPYAIAHLKLALKLGETGYQFTEGDRIHIYLTNSLERPSIMADSKLADMFTTLADEAQEVNWVKRNKRFTIVIGNPPYAKNSANRNAYAESLVQQYKELVKGETNVQPLSDDYVKFMAYSLNILSNIPSVFGMITNRSYLAGLIHRGMRELLSKYNERIFIIDLHGDSNVGEDAPKEFLNENVFDITQGVSISLISNSPLKHSHKVFFTEVWGNRNEKYAFLSESINPHAFKEILIEKPYFFFVPKDLSLSKEFDVFFGVDNIFGVMGMGVKSRRDHFLIDIDKKALVDKFQDLINNHDVNKQKVLLNVSDNNQWTLSKMKNLVKREGVENNIHPILYRPFDIRYIWYHREAIERGDARWPVMKNVLNGGISLIVSRQTQNSIPNAVFVSKGLSEMKAGESSRGSYALPLFIEDSSNQLITKLGKTVNIDLRYLSCISNIYECEIGDSNIKSTISYYDVFHYIYAILYSQGYRIRYCDLLKIQFPRIPIANNKTLFKRLSDIGADLVANHLLEANYIYASWNKHGITNEYPYTDNIVKYYDMKNREVINKYPKYQENKVFINKEEYFHPIPNEVWEYELGGYQVCNKWLNMRRGRRLTELEIQCYTKMVFSIKETMKLTIKIDSLIDEHGGWPDAFITDPKVYEEIRNADPFR